MRISTRMARREVCKACFVENNRKCVWIHSVAEILHAARWKMSKNPVRRRPFNPGQYAPLQLSRWHRKLLLDQISWMLKLEWAQTNYVSFSFNIPTVSLIPEEVNFRFEKKKTFWAQWSSLPDKNLAKFWIRLLVPVYLYW